MRNQVQSFWRQSRPRSFALILIGAVMVSLFQNCGGSGFDGGSLLSENASTGIDAKVKALPFPYEIQINQLAYMSCQNNGASSLNTFDSPWFTFKVGGYDNTSNRSVGAASLKSGGVQLRSEFMTAFETSFSNVNPDYFAAKLKETLQAYTESKPIQPILSLRKSSEPRTVPYARGGSVDGQVVKFFSSLSDQSVAAELVKKNSTVGKFGFLNKTTPPVFNEFIAGGSGSARNFSASLMVPIGGIDDQNKFQTDLYNNLLTVGFGNPNLNLSGSFGATPYGPSTDTSRMYGKGYRFVLGPNPAVTNSMTAYPSRLISSMSEVDLATGDTTSNAWSCVSYKIVRASDRLSDIKARGSSSGATIVKKACPFETVSQQSTAAKRAEVQILRRFLPAESWDLNITDRCVVPRDSAISCYPSGSKIIYDEVFTNPPSLATDIASCGDGKYFNDCAHYLSVCIRK